MEYLDFELEIGEGAGREYPVVLRSPAGEARETLRFPFDELGLKNQLLTLQNALLRSGGRRRRVLSPEAKVVQGFGQRLFDALLTGEVRSRYDVSRQEAQQQGKGLRLRLRIQAPGLAALPWEFLYDARQAAYLALSVETPITRYVEVPQPVEALQVTPPLQVLGMIASPRDLEGLDVERERQRVEEAVASLQRDGLVAVTWLAGQTWRDLLRAMRGGPWHIFHFIGHGGFDPQADEGVLALADDAGRSRLLTATELGMLLADHHPLRLALLNACESAQGSETDLFASTAATLIRRGLPAALAMQYEITDRAAIEFARTFYETLAEGRPVGMAVAEARKAISLAVANTLEWGTPVLYLRSPDDILFRTIERPVPSSPPPRPRRPATTRETPRTKEKGRGERATAVTDRIPESLTGNDGAEMVLVPSGEFWMGSEDKDADPDERPRHRMFLNAFYIDKFPVTNAQYRAFVAATGHDEPEFWTHPGFEGTNQPVVGVSWEDARAYCRWAAKRLPTEAEWEKAARGTEGQKYPWGEEWDPTRANSNDGGPGKPTAVGSYLTGVSPYGAHDMAGNVYEWTASQYRAYPYQADDGREDPASRGSRVIRGGSWAYDPRFLRVSCRNDTTPTNCNGGLGFRCARDVSP